jgi:hypothetical protein
MMVVDLDIKAPGGAMRSEVLGRIENEETTCSYPKSVSLKHSRTPKRLKSKRIWSINLFDRETSNG